MSVCHWICEGIGISTNDIICKINVKKCIKFLKEQLPDKEIKEKDFDIDDFLYGLPFDNFGDVLCHCDDTNTLTYGDNGEGEYYFFYAPSYPWERSNNEPTSVEEVHERIIIAVQKLCDLTSDQIEKLIQDDLYEYGCG